MCIYIAIIIQKSTKCPIFSTLFFAKKQFFEKISTRGGRQLIVLNPFLDSLGHSGLKNIGLPPGTGSGCFQSSQDIVKYDQSISWIFNLIFGGFLQFGPALRCSVSFVKMTIVLNAFDTTFCTIFKILFLLLNILAAQQWM